jgi:hypothetical protein
VVFVSHVVASVGLPLLDCSTASARGHLDTPFGAIVPVLKPALTGSSLKVIDQDPCHYLQAMVAREFNQTLLGEWDDED